MVFIEQKSNYLQKFEDGNDFCFLREFLQKGEVFPTEDESSFVHKLLFALSSNDVSPALEIVKDYAAKNPTSDSPFIYKDLLLFLFICVTQKFKLEQDWLLKLVNQRKSSEEEKKIITKTFENLLRNNLESKDNYFEIVIVYKDILGISEERESILNETYEKLSKKQFPYYESDFLNLIAIKAIDLIVLSKGITTYKDYEKLLVFSEKFDTRTEQIAKGIFYLTILIIFIPLIYITYKLFYGTPPEADWADKVFTVTAFIVTILTILGFSTRKNIEIILQNIIKKLFGKVT